MQASSHRITHIFQSSHILIHARSQRYIRFVMLLRVKVWSICLSDFPSSKRCCTYLHLFSSSFHSFHLETQTSIFHSIYWKSLLFHHTLFFISIFKLFLIIFFIRRGFLLFATNFKVESHFFFLFLPLGFLSSFLSRPLT